MTTQQTGHDRLTVRWASDDNLTIKFNPIPARVGQASQYRDDEFELFFAETGEKVVGPHKNRTSHYWQNVGTPFRQGDFITVDLQARKKTSERAGPDSWYQDVKAWSPIEHHDYSDVPLPDLFTDQTRDEGVISPEEAAEAFAPDGSPKVPDLSLDQRIAKGMAFNNLTQMMAAILGLKPNDHVSFLNGPFLSTGESINGLMQDWAEAYEDAKAGKTPFNRSVEPETGLCGLVYDETEAPDPCILPSNHAGEHRTEFGGNWLGDPLPEDPDPPTPPSDAQRLADEEEPGMVIPR